MAKNIKRMLAMVLVMVMFASALPMQALAAETEHTTETSPEGLTTEVYTTRDEDGKETIVVKFTEGTYTDEDGNIVTLERTESVDNTHAKPITSGTETKEWTEEDTGDGEQPPVTVELVPGAPSIGVASDTVNSGDLPTSSEDKNYDYTSTTTVERTVEATTEKSEITVESTGSSVYTPIQTDRDMINVEENQLHTHPKTSYCQTSSPVRDVNSRPEDEQYDFLFIGQGQMSDFYVGTEYSDGTTAHSGALQFELLYDPTLEDGQYVKNPEDLFTAYCIDLTTGAKAGYWYKMDNLEDAGYYSDEAAAQIRSIVSTGYWGTNPGEDEANPATGSLEKLQQALKAAGNSGLTDEEIDQLTPGQALAATQAAIWSYANATTGGAVVDEERLIITGYKAPTVPTDDDFKKAMAVYEFLRNLDPSAETESTEIIDKESFIEEDSMSITVGSKIESAPANEDEDQDNDVYDVAVNFALVVSPTDDDDLVVQVVRIGADGETIVEAQGRIAGNADNDEGFNEVIFNEETGTYSLKNLQLAENSDFSFDLKLVGMQYLQEGVYIFNSEVRNGSSSQTFVAMAEGHKEVNVKQSFVISFDVDETTAVVEKHVWNSDPNPVVPEETPEEPEEDPPVIFRLDPETTEEIPEEPIPLAAPVITGDNSFLWIVVVMIALCGVIAINFSDKKRAA